MPDAVPAQSGRHAAIELRGKPVAHGVYASERLSHGEAGKIAQGQSWSPNRTRETRPSRDETGGVRKRGLGQRLNGHVKRKRRNSQVLA